MITSDTNTPDTAALLALRGDPLGAARQATRSRLHLFGNNISILDAPRIPAPQTTGTLRRGEWIACDAWPQPTAWQPGDRVITRVEPDQAGRWVAYLLEILDDMDRWAARAPSTPPLAGFSLANFSRCGAATHDLWAMATARLLLPAQIRVEARHDLLGIHVAQISLHYGADTLAGPISDARLLPLAGVSRPNETSREALEALVRQAGLTPGPDKCSREADGSHAGEIASPLSIDDDQTRAMDIPRAKEDG